MRIFKRAFPLAVVSAVSMLSWAIPAHATTGTAACAIAGSADAPVNLVGGTGNYSFNELAGVCAGTVEGKPAAAVLDISSTGTFANSICGTGSATSSTADVTAAAVDPLAGGFKRLLEEGDLSYGIDFTAGVGLMRWTGSTTNGVIAYPVPLGPKFAGVIALGPNPLATPNAASDCVDGFSVAGAISATIAIPS